MGLERLKREEEERQRQLEEERIREELRIQNLAEEVERLQQEKYQ